MSRYHTFRFWSLNIWDGDKHNNNIIASYAPSNSFGSRKPGALPVRHTVLNQTRFSPASLTLCLYHRITGRWSFAGCPAQFFQVAFRFRDRPLHVTLVCRHNTDRQNSVQCALLGISTYNQHRFPPNLIQSASHLQGRISLLRHR